jgi:hypothetical protein
MTHTHKPIIIGLAGAAGSGKDSVRSVLELQHDFAGISFADPMRDMLRTLLVSTGSSDEYLTRRDLKEVPIPGLGVSYRHMAQTLGTEWGRQCLHPEFWLRTAHNTLAFLRGQGYCNFVVSDVRFANEAEWVRNQGGEIWMLDRPGTAPVRAHISEARPFEADRVVANTGTLADLRDATYFALVAARGVAERHGCAA